MPCVAALSGPLLVVKASLLQVLRADVAGLGREAFGFGRSFHITEGQEVPKCSQTKWAINLHGAEFSGGHRMPVGP